MSRLPDPGHTNLRRFNSEGVLESALNGEPEVTYRGPTPMHKELVEMLRSVLGMW